MRKENSVMIENGRVIRQASCDKCFYVVIKFLVSDQLKAGFLSRQRKLCHDIKFRVQNEMQQDFVTTKKFYVAANTT